jgi:hypothetical protein
MHCSRGASDAAGSVLSPRSIRLSTMAIAVGGGKWRCARIGSSAAYQSQRRYCCGSVVLPTRPALPRRAVRESSGRRLARVAAGASAAHQIIAHGKCGAFSVLENKPAPRFDKRPLSAWTSVLGLPHSQIGRRWEGLRPKCARRSFSM